MSTRHYPELYAWCTLVDKRFSLVGFMDLVTREHVPMISHDRAQLERLRDIAVNHGRTLKQPVYFVRFGSAEILETLGAAKG